MSITQRTSEQLEKANLDAMYVTDPDSIFYLTGFRGLVPTDREALVVVTKDTRHLIIPRMYESLAQRSVHKEIEVTVIEERDQFEAALEKLLKEVQRCGFESKNLTYNEFERFKKKKLSTLVPQDDFFTSMRLQKTEEEVALIKKAQETTFEALDSIKPILKPGVTELEVRSKLDAAMTDRGAEGPSFEAIVAFGKGSAEPHYKTSNNRLRGGDMVLIDCGAIWQGYCGDTTRMFFTETPSSQLAKMYHQVLSAQQNAIDNIKAGDTSQQAFDYANDQFKESHVEKLFLHGLGHGIGIAVHEAPSIRNKNEKEKLTEGMVFSVEPGLYDKELGGIRVEDLVVCRKDSVEVLGEYTREVVVLS